MDSRNILGVMGTKPIHVLSTQELERVVTLDDLYIDIGLNSPDEVRAKGIEVVPLPHSMLL